MNGRFHMNRTLLKQAAFALCVLAPSVAFAAEKTVTLAVRNMDCAACPHTVKASLQAVPGVAKVAVSYRDKTAIVTFDDAKTGVDALTTATTNAGYPSAPKS
jgi:periplasmic mercuric ion binding protein